MPLIPPLGILDVPIQDRSTLLHPPSQSSARRRKPLVTYRSPCSQYPVGNFIERRNSNDGSTTESTTPPHLPVVADVALTFPAYSSSSVSSSSPPGLSRSSSMKNSPRSSPSKTPTTLSIYALAPKLPLYHPLGPLAMSLGPLSSSNSIEHQARPLLDPLQSDTPQASSSRSRPAGTSNPRTRTSGRSRKAVAKLREKPDDDPIARSTEDDDPNEVTSPRKRRTAVATAATTAATANTTPPTPEEPNVAKRKRKEVDDGDSIGSLPPVPLPKRSRNRGGRTASDTAVNDIDMASPSSPVVPDVQEDEMSVDKDVDPPVNISPARTNGRARRGRSTGTRRNGRRVARKDKEKDKDSSLEDEEMQELPPVVVPQAADDAAVTTVVEDDEIKSQKLNDESETKT